MNMNMMMRRGPIVLAIGCLVALGGEGMAGQGAPSCEGDGDIRFICGLGNPEDLVRIADTPWVVASGMEDDGHLYAVDVRDHGAVVLYPHATAGVRFDRGRYGACPGPETDGFRPHGLSLRPGADGVSTLYVVRHGRREAVEVFELDARGERPTTTWIGCVVAPDGVGLNSVAALPGDAFAVTNFDRPEGEVWEWRPDAGWAVVAGSATSGPNGLVASEDGRRLFIGGWGTRSLIRLGRGEAAEGDVVGLGFHIDNLRWAPDGTLLVAGHDAQTPEALFACLGTAACDGVTSRVARVDPETLEVEGLVRYPSNEFLRLGTVAIQVEDELWVGGVGGGNRIARFPLTPR